MYFLYMPFRRCSVFRHRRCIYMLKPNLYICLPGHRLQRWIGQQVTPALAPLLCLIIYKYQDFLCCFRPVANGDASRHSAGSFRPDTRHVYTPATACYRRWQPALLHGGLQFADAPRAAHNPDNVAFLKHQVRVRIKDAPAVFLDAHYQALGFLPHPRLPYGGVQQR